MKSSILRKLVPFCLSATLGSVGLMAQEHIKVTIPFDFTAGAKSFTAGEYDIRPFAPRVLTILKAGGPAGFLMPNQTDNVAEKSGNAVLRFHRYGDQYFLYQISDGNRCANLPKSPLEKELLATREPFQSTVLMASK